MPRYTNNYNYQLHLILLFKSALISFFLSHSLSRFFLSTASRSPPANPSSPPPTSSLGFYLLGFRSLLSLSLSSSYSLSLSTLISVVRWISELLGREAGQTLPSMAMAVSRNLSEVRILFFLLLLSICCIYDSSTKRLMISDVIV